MQDTAIKNFCIWARRELMAQVALQARRYICINIISSKIIIIAYRENDRQEIFLQKIFQDLRLNLCNLEIGRASCRERVFVPV